MSLEEIKTKLSQNTPFIILHDKDTKADAVTASDNARIMLTKEPWDGIIYRYGAVEYVGNETDEDAKILFDVDILEPIELRTKVETGGTSSLDPELQKYFGDVIMYMIVSQGLEKEKENNENRTNDSMESST